MKVISKLNNQFGLLWSDYLEEIFPMSAKLTSSHGVPCLVILSMRDGC